MSVPVADGSRGAAPCLTCYADGTFKAADARAVAMRDAAIAALAAQGAPPLTATRRDATQRD